MINNKEILDKRRFEKDFTDYVNVLIRRSPINKIKEFAEFRMFSIETVKESDIFYIGEMGEMLVPDYLDKLNDFGVISQTNLKPIFHNRWVIPIKNERGYVQNLVGYNPNADERYIYGTAKYYRRRETLYGLENISIAYKNGYAILTEGITDTIRLRDMGYKNTFAKCGTHKSEFQMKQLNRCKHGIIRIPDRDDAGLNSVKHWNCNRHLTLLVSLQYKDVDEMCREEGNREWFNSYMAECINWIKSDEHRGIENICETVTMI